MNPVKVKSRLLLLELNCRPLLLGCSVRYYARKPRWVPIAKSKMFVNKELPYQPVYEEEEITRLTNNYQIYNKSLWCVRIRNKDKERLLNQVIKYHIVSLSLISGHFNPKLMPNKTQGRNK